MKIGGHARPLRQRAGALALAVAMSLAAGTAWPNASSPGAKGVVAEVGRDVITADGLDLALGPRRYRSAQQRYEFQRQKLDELINDKLLEQEAARRGVSVERLKETEVKAHVRVTPQEVDAFYRERKDSIPAPESVARQTLTRYLEQQRELEGTRRLLERLRAKTRVQVKLQPPPSPAEYLAVSGAPVKGPPNAPVTIVEYSDFQCPFCARARIVLQQVLDTYPDQVKLVFRHFPLERHPEAKLAAEAGECAARQGRFWEYHDQLFAGSPELSLARLHSLAESLGLDRQAFSTCLEAGASRAKISEDLELGRRAGVTATPTFFVDGHMLEGAQPFATFKKIIDQHLVLRRPGRAAQGQ